MRSVNGPLVIAHRGASGHRPEHTSLAYRLAWRQGADSVETDVVSTRDGVLLCRHDLELSKTTDIAGRPEFAGRRRSFRTGSRARSGWYVQDFDLAELRQLKSRERWPKKRPGSARYDDQVGLLTLEDLLDLRAAESARGGRQLGVHIELKSPGMFESVGLPLHEPLTDLLRRYGLTGSGSAATVMSFDSRVLETIRRRVDTRQVRLFDKVQRVRRRDVERTAGFAEGIGLHKNLVLPRNSRDQVGRPGKGVGRVMERGLDVLVWTLRSENRHLPAELRSGRRGRDHGDAAREVEWFMDLGVAGVITDFPDVAVDVRGSRATPIAL